MYKSFVVRKAEFLASHPEFSCYLDDILREIASRTFHNVFFSSEQRGFEIQVEHILRISEQKICVLSEIELAIARGATITAGWPAEVELWFEGYRKRIMPFGNSKSIIANAPNATELLVTKLNEHIQCQNEMKEANKIISRVFSSC